MKSFAGLVLVLALLGGAETFPTAVGSQPMQSGKARKWHYGFGWLRKDLARKAAAKYRKRGYETKIFYDGGWWKVYYR
jgi:hypothetical protein